MKKIILIGYAGCAAKFRVIKNGTRAEGPSRGVFNDIIEALESRGYGVKLIRPSARQTKLDILICGPFGNAERVLKTASKIAKVCLFATAERLSRMAISNQVVMECADFWMGYTRVRGTTLRLSGDCHLYRLPHWLHYYTFKFLHPSSKECSETLSQYILPKTKAGWGKVGNRKRAVSFVANNNAGGSRMRLVHQLRRIGLRVDCGGKLGNNVKKVPGQPGAKRKFISQYIFNLCPENGREPGYVTEKLIEACIEGCIPIYWGDEQLEPWINKSRVIMCDKAGQLGNAATAKIKELLNSPLKLQEFFEQPVFTPSVEQFFQDYRKSFDQLIGKVESKII